MGKRRHVETVSEMTKVTKVEDDSELNQELLEKAEELAVAHICRVRAGKECLPSDSFQFYIISKGRPHNVTSMQQLFFQNGPQPIWLVGEGEAEVYTKAGATKVIEGGKLCPSRNLALDLAAKASKVCVQLSDDLSVFEYLEHHNDCGATLKGTWLKPTTQQEANSMIYHAVKHSLTPVGAARILEAFMRQKDAKLGGVYPCMNSGFAFNQPPVTTINFVVGDFIVIDTQNEHEEVNIKPKTRMKLEEGEGTMEKGLRFDERFLLKEDYDFTAQHLQRYGCVVRHNRLFVKALHRINEGGAVADRTAVKENKMIKLLREKWPGVFTGHRRKNEVMMMWKYRKPLYGVDIAKEFDGVVFKGFVSGFSAATEELDEDLYAVDYEDGDREDLNETELQTAIDLFKKINNENGEMGQPSPSTNIMVEPETPITSSDSCCDGPLGVAT